MQKSVTEASAKEKVNIDNFIRAESDCYFKRKSTDGCFGVMRPYYDPPSVDEQLVVRMNRDTLYTWGIFDLTTPVTIIKPEVGDRFQSLVALNQDHYIKLVAYDPGQYELTQEMIGTRYVHVSIRTLVDPNDPADVKAVNAIQDQIQWKQESPGKLELPDWDQDTLSKVRAAIVGLTPFTPDSKGMFGDEDEIDPVRHLIGTAAGWGGNREQDAIYLNITPENNDGRTSYILTIKDVPVDGFWSISVYNAKGYFEKNPQNAYSLNNLTAHKDNDGTFTIRFGGDPRQPNYLAIMPGWNYTFRFYKPRKEIVDGTWTAPKLQPVQ